MNRREFLQASLAAAGTLLVAPRSLAATAAPRPQPKIPRWRGFNLQGALPGTTRLAFPESDYEMMAGWGFNFARLPVSYWTWAGGDPWQNVAPKDWSKIDESAFAPIDDAIERAGKHNIYINFCMHRVPGYCVNGRELEPHLLFDSPHDEMQRALDMAVHHWQYVARRYKDIPSTRLSFDLFNEPPFMKDQSRYVEVARTLIAAIREVSPDRLICADGADIGQTPVMGLVDQSIIQSTRGYLPKMISHYTAGWVPPNEFESLEKPTWPMVDKHGVRWDREKLRAELITKWEPLTKLGVPIHVGEWGCFNKTPHAACLGWMTDLLALWKEANWGWAMWSFRGSFGILDSERADVAYENYKGHKLDRKMLELLLAG
ncbi:MAG TPA: cellulase family glycosylhydrolase [Candidatus Didemnitutus sp.]|nr:cellulase family glycosylhydrolase [Candidatus Didemnitutus sp.]